MTEDEARKYFNRHARYVPDSPEGRGYKYAIRQSPTATVSFFADDTLELWDKFWAAANPAPEADSQL